MICDSLQAIAPDVSAADLEPEVTKRIDLVHRALREEALRRDPGAMLASTVVAFLAGEERFTCLWAGDSRAYLLRDGVLRLLTRDHSLVQDLVDSGAISAKEAESHPHANIITRAVGADPDALDLDKVEGDIRHGDRFLLCCDGVFKTLPETTMAKLLASEHLPPAEALIRAALAEKASDNVTAVTV